MDGRIEARTVREVMTASPITVSPGASPGEVKALFETHDFNAFPVTDAAGVLRGVVTKLDLLRMFRPERFRWIPDFQVPWAECVEDLMTRGVVTVGPEDSVVTAMDRMIEHGVRSLPVVERREDQPVLVGVVSRTDLLRCLIFEGTTSR